MASEHISRLTCCILDRVGKTAQSFLWSPYPSTFFSYFLLMKYFPFHSSSYRAVNTHMKLEDNNNSVCASGKRERERETETERKRHERKEERERRDEESVKLWTVK